MKQNEVKNSWGKKIFTAYIDLSLRVFLFFMTKTYLYVSTEYIPKHIEL